MAVAADKALNLLSVCIQPELRFSTATCHIALEVGGPFLIPHISSLRDPHILRVFAHLPGG